ncbi:hypothetical protein NEOLEDRAFT_746727 [Neolentinus lepideus HHB14362 ss-1]|uniref:Uncharacterized protein n=1 Tax=Neolentinus lepideus HHB14362 ss-1 TaxID=1314782 RepID=A0A165PTB8_9AGAM|nr:hypothetical protein NEOLEDRAFT_746727 [Neolentinus lepideus HHB14362 ss-1]
MKPRHPPFSFFMGDNILHQRGSIVLETYKPFASLLSCACYLKIFSYWLQQSRVSRYQLRIQNNCLGYRGRILHGARRLQESETVLVRIPWPTIYSLDSPEGYSRYTLIRLRTPLRSSDQHLILAWSFRMGSWCGTAAALFRRCRYTDIRHHGKQRRKKR